jgi:hypothetical protein
LQLAEVAIAEQPAEHVRQDLARTLLVKLVAGREFEPIIEP